MARKIYIWDSKYAFGRIQGEAKCLETFEEQTGTMFMMLASGDRGKQIVETTKGDFQTTRELIDKSLERVCLAPQLKARSHVCEESGKCSDARFWDVGSRCRYLMVGFDEINLNE